LNTLIDRFYGTGQLIPPLLLQDINSMKPADWHLPFPEKYPRFSVCSMGSLRSKRLRGVETQSVADIPNSEIHFKRFNR
jgi:hypothetical protein